MCYDQFQQLNNNADKAKQQEKENIFRMVQLEIISPCEARKILEVDKFFPDTRPICPDCKQVMVKTHIELGDKSGWFSGWGCGCKYEPKN